MNHVWTTVKHRIGEFLFDLGLLVAVGWRRRDDGSEECWWNWRKP